MKPADTSQHYRYETITFNPQDRLETVWKETYRATLQSKLGKMSDFVAIAEAKKAADYAVKMMVEDEENS